jgi:hypothetical protein
MYNEEMAGRILLVNPPIYDFTAYDFWLRPLGLLRLGGMLRTRAKLELFDFLDRGHPSLSRQDDSWARGQFPRRIVSRPGPLRDVPRRFARYGLAPETFVDFLDQRGPFDAALITSGMTYWYPGVDEVVEQLRKVQPNLPIALGGVYASLCPDHAARLGADFVAGPDNLDAFWDWLGMEPEPQTPPLWEAYSTCPAGAMTLSDGCPSRCPYCASRRISGPYAPREIQASLEELEHLATCGARDVAFYDDALLVRADKVLLPFLEGVGRRGINVRFHTPNALHSHLLSQELAREMVLAGFETFFLGSESARSPDPAEPLEVSVEALGQATEHLRRAGVDANRIVAYVIVGHPRTPYESLLSQLAQMARIGVRIMPAEFSPIPTTADAALCADRTDMSEPLCHNKTAWSLRSLGSRRLQHLKDLARGHNRAVERLAAQTGR